MRLVEDALERLDLHRPVAGVLTLAMLPATADWRTESHWAF